MDHVCVLMSTSSAKRISIADVSGRTILDIPSTTDQLTVIPTTSLAQGIYWLSVIQSEERKVKKLVIN